MEKDEYDWIFDYALQFLESDKFDAAVMDFVDEKCVYFENTEENKFIYSDIHDEFRQHIEALIASNLGELGLTTELFFESCQKARNRRDINQTVFERLTAIDDFQTFKKVMTKRNIELQIEAMQNTYNDGLVLLDNDNNGISQAKGRNGNTGNNNGSSSSSGSYVLRDEMYTSASEKFRRAAREDDYGDHDAKKTSSSATPSSSYLSHHNRDFEELEADEEKLQDILRQSLLELEILHRQAELEQHQLEQALAMSLAIEEDRLRSLMLNNNGINYNKGDFSGRSGIHTGRMGNITGRSDNGGNEYDESYYYEFYTSGRDKNPYRADAKLESKSISQTVSPNKNDDDDDYKAISSNGVNNISLNNTNRHISPPMTEVISTQQHQRLNNPNNNNTTAPTIVAVADTKQPLPTLNTIKSTHLSNTGISGFKGTALPPISSTNNNANNSIEVEVQLLNEKKREIQATIQKNQLQLQQQKLTENQLRNQIQATNTSSTANATTNTTANNTSDNDTQQMKMMNEKDVEKRAAYMKQQRDKLIAMKKAEREKKAVEEEERMNRKGVIAATRATERQVEDAVHRLNQQAEKQVDPSSSSSSSIEVENERKRNDVRLALARRMKIDLIQQQQQVEPERKGQEESKNNNHFVASSSSSSLSSEQDQQQSSSIVNYAYFDKRLKEAERIRLENQEKAQVLADKIKLQQQRGGGSRE